VLYTPFDVDTINVVSAAAAKQVVNAMKPKAITTQNVETKAADFCITFQLGGVGQRGSKASNKFQCLA
jgi:hypothetical protein